MKLISILTLSLAFSAFANDWERARQQERNERYEHYYQDILIKRKSVDHLNQELTVAIQESQQVKAKADQFANKFFELRAKDRSSLDISLSDFDDIDYSDNLVLGERERKSTNLLRSLDGPSPSSSRTKNRELRSLNNESVIITTDVNSLANINDAIDFYNGELLPALEQSVINMDNIMKDMADFGNDSYRIHNASKLTQRGRMQPAFQLTDGQISNITGQFNHIKAVFDNNRDRVSTYRGQITGVVSGLQSSMR